MCSGCMYIAISHTSFNLDFCTEQEQEVGFDGSNNPFQFRFFDLWTQDSWSSPLPYRERPCVNLCGSVISENYAIHFSWGQYYPTSTVQHYFQIQYVMAFPQNSSHLRFKRKILFKIPVLRKKAIYYKLNLLASPCSTFLLSKVICHLSQKGMKSIPNTNYPSADMTDQPKIRNTEMNWRFCNILCYTIYM